MNKFIKVALVGAVLATLRKLRLSGPQLPI